MLHSFLTFFMTSLNSFELLKLATFAVMSKPLPMPFTLPVMFTFVHKLKWPMGRAEELKKEQGSAEGWLDRKQCMERYKRQFRNCFSNTICLLYHLLYTWPSMFCGAWRVALIGSMHAWPLCSLWVAQFMDYVQQKTLLKKVTRVMKNRGRC